VTGAPATWRFLVRLVAVIAVLLGSLQIGLPPVGATSSSKAPTTTAAPSLDCTYDRAPEVAQKLVEPMGFPNAGEWTAADGYLGNLPAPAIRQASVIAAETGAGRLGGLRSRLPSGDRGGSLGDGGIEGATGGVGKLANQFGYTTKQIRIAIHAVKRGAAFPGNPDVVIDGAGEVYPVGSDGVAGDSIGNIFEHLGG